MEYFTERNGLRENNYYTYTISQQAYSLLLECCKKYYNNIAWKYPEECLLGQGCIGVDLIKMTREVKCEIPGLFINGEGLVGTPPIAHYVSSDDTKCNQYSQYALLDYIEFIATNCRDVKVGDVHAGMSHSHLCICSSDDIFLQFKNEVNSIFGKAGVLYELNSNKQIERVLDNFPLDNMIENEVDIFSENGTKQLIEEAISLFKSPKKESSKYAVEKIWDAYERLKSYYTDLGKKQSAEKIVEQMSSESEPFRELLNEEFMHLTKIGNTYRIRHHETDKIEITDIRHYDYLFNRCLSLISVAIRYLNGKE